MRDSNHPALRSTRYHWAAGLNPLHWLPAVCGWTAAAILSADGNSSAGAALIEAACAMGALGWSMAWLLIVPVMPAFRRVVDSRLAAQFDADFYYQSDATLGRYPALKPEVRSLTELRERAREIMLRRFGKDDPFAQDNLKKLDRLAVSYLELLAQQAEYADYLRTVSAEGLERDVREARAELESAGDELRSARLRQLELLESRQQRYREAEERVKLIRAEAGSVETTMKLLADQAMSSASSRGAWDDIDAVLTNMQDSELLSADLAVFDDIERKISKTELKHRK